MRYIPAGINNVVFAFKESIGASVHLYRTGRVTIVNCRAAQRRCAQGSDAQEDGVKKERYADGMGKMRGATVAVINHPRSYSGDPFRFLLAKRRSSEQRRNGSTEESARGRGRQRFPSRRRDAVLRTQQNITRFR